MKQSFVFEKMHGIGNDFVLIDNRDQGLSFSGEQIQVLADRHKGIGFDQLLWLEDSEISTCDVAYRFFNPDGSEAEQCGNGQRCIAQYLKFKSADQSRFSISGLAGIIDSKVDKDGLVTVNMGSYQALNTVTIDKKLCHHVLFGNPHLVTVLNNVDACDLAELNHSLSQDYVDGINVEIVEIINRDKIKIRVYERGTGETLACGSGACAVVIALQYNGQLNNRVKVLLPGGILMVEYRNNKIYLTGPAEHVFTGEMTI